MALIDCPDCNTQVSSAAVSCPKCGFPIASSLEEQGRSRDADAPVLQDGGPVLGHDSLRDSPIARELDESPPQRQPAPKSSATETRVAESRKAGLVSERAKYILAGLLVLGFFIWFWRTQSSNESGPRRTSGARVEQTQPTQAPERDEQEPPQLSPWERVCSNPIVRIQPAIARTGLKITGDYIRSRGRITDGTGPWGGYSGQCATLGPELGEGLAVVVYLGPKDADTGYAGAPLRCKRMADARQVVEHIVGYLQRRGLPMDRPVSADVMCTTVRKGSKPPLRIAADTYAIFNHETQRIEMENRLTGKRMDHALPLQAVEHEPEPEPEPPPPPAKSGCEAHRDAVVNALPFGARLVDVSCKEHGWVEVQVLAPPSTHENRAEHILKNTVRGMAENDYNPRTRDLTILLFSLVREETVTGDVRSAIDSAATYYPTVDEVRVTQ